MTSPTTTAPDPFAPWSVPDVVAPISNNNEFPPLPASSASTTSHSAGAPALIPSLPGVEEWVVSPTPGLPLPSSTDPLRLEDLPPLVDTMDINGESEVVPELQGILKSQGSTKGRPPIMTKCIFTREDYYDNYEQE